MSSGRRDRTVRVFVYASQDDRALIEAAVRDAGGVLSSAESAEAVIWASNDVEALIPFLFDGVRWVQLYAAGVDAWIRGGVIDRSRLWTAGKGVYGAVIAEYCLALLLACAARLPEAARARAWNPLTADSISGKTVGVIGAGGIGSELIRLLEPFGARTLAITRTGRTVQGATESYGLGGLDRVLRDSDYVALCAASTPQSRGLLSRERIALMKPNSFVVNIARGALIDTDALVEAIDEGRVRGAALDVTDPEPLPDDHPLWHLPTVIVTPHMSGSAPAWRESFAARLRENVARYIADSPLLGVVDLDLGY